MTTAVAPFDAAPPDAEPARAAGAKFARETGRLPLVPLSITLILCLLYGPDDWYVRAFVAVVSIAGLIWRSSLTSPWLWLALASLLGSSVFVERFTADNHQYLMVYWTLSVALALWTSNPESSLRTSARVLIGLAFLFATGWKVFSPDFLNGSFLEFTLLSDQRFAGFAAWISGTSADAFGANRDAIKALFDDVGGAPVVLQGPAKLRTVAVAMAWFTLAIEAWIAASFLVPTSLRISRTRDVALNAFLLTTYAVATVPGFAYLLIAMGLTQCEQKPRWIRWMYFVALFSTQIYTMPWARVAARITGGS